MTVLLRTMPAPLLRILRKMLTQCIQCAYMQENGTPCPPYLSKVRDLSILPNILQVDIAWWQLSLQQVAALFHYDFEDFYQQLLHNVLFLSQTTMQEIGYWGGPGEGSQFFACFWLPEEELLCCACFSAF